MSSRHNVYFFRYSLIPPRANSSRFTNPEMLKLTANVLLRNSLFSTHFLTSFIPPRANVSRFTNPEMCKLTEKVIFAEPYTVASNNNYLPALEPAVQALQNDLQAKVWGK